MQYSKYQLDIFDWVKNPNPHKKNLVVKAAPGSGKSTTALSSIPFMVGDVLMLAFNKRISVELQEKISRMGLPNAKSSTFHSEALSNYTRAKGKVNVSNSKVYFITEKYCQSEALSPARNFITKLVGFAKDAAFGVKGQTSIDDTQAWMDIISHHDISLDADVDYFTVIEIAKEVLRDNNRDFRNIDFADMLYLSLIYDIPFKTYPWVIVDEAQDTNVARKLLLNKFKSPDGRLMAIGDENQSCYGWCGAEMDSLNLIKDMFDCEELPLSVCYRCGKVIIEEAKKYFTDIEYFEGNPDGEITSMKYQDFIDNALQMGLNRTWGVVCRNNAPNVALAFALIRQGIGVRIEGKDIGANLLTLTKKWRKIKTLEEFTGKITQFFEKEFEKASRVQMQLLEDKLETLCILIERCQSLGKNDIYSLQTLIQNMFTDSGDGPTPDIITLSSIHKAKGLEFDTCVILGEDQFQPSKYATLDWMKEAEKCLSYIAVTRAKNKLIKLTEVPTRRGNNKEEN